MSGTRFNLIALALNGNNLMTSPALASTLLRNLPDIIRNRGKDKMKDKDEARLANDEPLTNREELYVNGTKGEVSSPPTRG